MQPRPLLAFWNKEYAVDKKAKELKALLTNFAKALITWAGDDIDPDSIGYVKRRYFFGDDLFVSLRNCGFLEDELFKAALSEFCEDPILRGRIWRTWVLCWSLSCQWTKEGDAVDCGTYNGKAFITACRYACMHNGTKKRPGGIVCADLFENPPEEAKKSEHGPDLYNKVKLLFKEFEQAKIIKGHLPKSIAELNIERISWAQIDLNSAESDLNTFKFIYPKLQPKAHVIFDDYGFSRYHKTQEKLDKFLDNKTERILELPTGQGLFIKD